MSDELHPDIIKRTQNTLGKYVKKPSLTEKLLKKPPFRFLHDVFGVVIRDTKCFVGLYSLEELTYENIKDRDDKMKFLQKMIDVVKLTTGLPLAVKTSKIVAGHEPEKTNELLQLMGEIIDNKLDWQTSVEQVLSGIAVRKESPKKFKDTTNKITKDIKAKEKLKEKESRIKEPKTSKASASKITTTANKDDKSKMGKTKDKTSKKLASKERSLKGNKEKEMPVKKEANGASNIKPKLMKSESQSSNNKSSTSPNTQESKKELKSIQNKIAECNHEKIEQQEENPKIITPPRKLSQTSENNQASSSNEENDKPEDSAQLNNFETDNSKPSSVKSRKSERFVERLDDKEHAINFDIVNIAKSQEKSETSEDGIMDSSKADSFATPTSHAHQRNQISSESSSLNKNQQESPSLPQKSAQKASQPSAAGNLTNEVKRETTFTRENSKESLPNRPRTSLRPPSARPPSARPGAPRRRDKNIEIILQPNDQIKMSGIQVKLETFGDLDDDGENLVIIENSNASDMMATVQHANATESEIIIQDEALEQGHLVQQILKTQKELVQQQNDASGEEKSDKDSSNNSVMRQTSAHHINNLRDVIQNLTKSINPLGKLMDFIPEDIDAMQLEFTLWRDAYIQAANELKREKSLTESATEPMKNQLAQIEANIVEYMEMINASRVKILQSSEKIVKMLTTA